MYDDHIVDDRYTNLKTTYSVVLNFYRLRVIGGYKRIELINWFRRKKNSKNTVTFLLIKNIIFTIMYIYVIFLISYYVKW